MKVVKFKVDAMAGFQYYRRGDIAQIPDREAEQLVEQRKATIIPNARVRSGFEARHEIQEAADTELKDHRAKEIKDYQDKMVGRAPRTK